jgi:hypothetical protein
VSDLPSKQVAQTKALAGCKAVDCKILITFKKGECATLSLDASKTTRQAYVSFADNEVSAKNSARQACVAGGGRNCKVAPVVCN